MKRYIVELKDTAQTYEVPLSGPLGSLMMYLNGVYYQGIGKLDKALEIYQDDRLMLLPAKTSNTSSADQVVRDIALLAALNALWINQDQDRRDANRNTALIEKLGPLCRNHPNTDIETAYNLIVATITTNPPTLMFEIKKYLRTALNGAQATGNTQFLCITLNVMCNRFFSGVIGDQAEKSALAASMQAKNSGNALWKSVASGMLAQSYEVQGKKEKAREAEEQAQKFAQQALPDT